MTIDALRAATFDAHQFDPSALAQPQQPFQPPVWLTTPDSVPLSRTRYIHGQDWAMVWVLMAWAFVFGMVLMFGVAHFWR